MGPDGGALLALKALTLEKTAHNKQFYKGQAATQLAHK